MLKKAIAGMDNKELKRISKDIIGCLGGKEYKASVNRLGDDAYTVAMFEYSMYGILVEVTAFTEGEIHELAVVASEAMKSTDVEDVFKRRFDILQDHMKERRTFGCGRLSLFQNIWNIEEAEE
jgi:hypothetical protein